MFWNVKVMSTSVIYIIVTFLCIGIINRGNNVFIDCLVFRLSNSKSVSRYNLYRIRYTCTRLSYRPSVELANSLNRTPSHAIELIADGYSIEVTNSFPCFTVAFDFIILSDSRFQI